MLETLWRIIPLGIGAAFTPSLMALQILATRGPHWVARTLMVTVGAATAFGLACTALYVGFAQLPADRPDSPRLIQGILLLAAAVLLVGMAVWLFRPHPELVARSNVALARRLDRTRSVTFFSVAFLLSIKDVTSFALLIPGLHDIATTTIPVEVKALLALLLFVLALSPVLLPPLWRFLRGEKATDLLERVYAFTMRHQFHMLGILSLVFAVYCLVMSLGKSGLAVAPW